MAKIIIDSKYCKSCYLCVNACPFNLITKGTILTDSGLPIAQQDDPQEKCTGCKLCACMCPDAAISVFK